jgi:hypothetical protein
MARSILLPMLNAIGITASRPDPCPDTSEVDAVAAAFPEQLPAETAALWGAFLHEGLMLSVRDPARPARVLDAWGQGCIELLTEACRCLDTVWLYRRAYPASRGLPGVFEYEVISELGESLGNHVLTHGLLPDDATQQALIRERVQAFFALGAPGE